MQNKIFCEDCKTELTIKAPPFPPQMCNSGTMSAVVMVNGLGECPKCKTRYITQITGCQVSLGFKKVEEDKRIVVPTGPIPDLKAVH